MYKKILNLPDFRGFYDENVPKLETLSTTEKVLNSCMAVKRSMAYDAPTRLKLTGNSDSMLPELGTITPRNTRTHIFRKFGLLQRRDRDTRAKAPEMKELKNKLKKFR